MSHARILFIPPLASMAAPYLLVDRAGHVVGRGRLEPDRIELLDPIPTIALVPGAEVLVRWLDLPAGNPAQVRAAARWQLKGELAADNNGLDLALGPIPREGGRRMVALAATSLVQTWLDWCASWGIVPQTLVPDSLCLPEDEGPGLVAAQRGGDVILRGPDMALGLQADLISSVIQDQPLTWLTDEALEAALVTGALKVPLNLLETRDHLARGEKAKGWRLAAGLALVLLFSPLILMTAKAGHDSLKVSQIKAEAHNAAIALYPDLKTSGQAVPQALSRLEAAPPPGGIARSMAVVFTAVEGLEGAELEDVSLGEEGLRLTLSHLAYADLDSLRASLAQSGLVIVGEITSEEAGHMVSSLSLKGEA